MTFSISILRAILAQEQLLALIPLLCGWLCWQLLYVTLSSRPAQLALEPLFPLSSHCWVPFSGGLNLVSIVRAAGCPLGGFNPAGLEGNGGGVERFIFVLAPPVSPEIKSRLRRTFLLQFLRVVGSSALVGLRLHLSCGMVRCQPLVVATLPAWLRHCRQPLVWTVGLRPRSVAW